MLRRPARRTNPGRSRTAVTRSQAAPVRGWNTRDGIANMPPGFAVTLDNWFPMTSEIVMRRGSDEHVTSIVDGTMAAVEVETLASYKPKSGDQELFAWADDSIYDVSTPGAVGAAVVSSLTNARWQHTNFSTSGGQFLIAVNGADNLRLYNGTAWAAINGVSTPAITNVGSDDLVHVTVFKERVWYVEVDSLNAWYAAVGAFAGALTQFSLTSVVKKGGYLVAIGAWTRDTGAGADDRIVFVTSQGEVAVYEGINPASDFELVGVYEIAKPIGRRCTQKFGGDLLLITTDGVVPMSRVVAQERSKEGFAVTDVIQGSMAQAVSRYSANFGWELFLYSEGSMLLLNVPVDAEQVQFVMNSYTKAWCRFLQWPAICFAEMDGDLYFGMLGEVRQAWTGTADLEEAIVAETVFNFTYFGDRSSIKQTGLVRPIMSYDVSPGSIKIGIDADFNVKVPGSDIVNVPTAGSVWDTAEWDEAFWSGDPAVQANWYSYTAIGYALAFHTIVESTQSASVSLASVDISYKRGSTL